MIFPFTVGTLIYILYDQTITPPTKNKPQKRELKYLMVSLDIKPTMFSCLWPKGIKACLSRPLLSQ